jgi:hypothetical protein
MMARRIIVGVSNEGAEADGEVLFPGVGELCLGKQAPLFAT